MNIEEGVIKAKAILDNHNEIDKMIVIEMVELVETLLTAYEKEKEKNKNARERIEYYLVENFALNDFDERNKELRKIEEILEE